jgi:hypothetical protein
MPQNPIFEIVNNATKLYCVPGHTQIAFPDAFHMLTTIRDAFITRLVELWDLTYILAVRVISYLLPTLSSCALNIPLLYVGYPDSTLPANECEGDYRSNVPMIDFRDDGMNRR